MTGAATERWREALHAMMAAARRAVGQGRRPEVRALARRCRVSARALHATPLEQARFVVIDMEATGPHPYAGDRAVSIALLELRGLRPTGRAYERLLDPGRPVSDAARRLHGLDREALRGKPRLEDVLAEVLDFLGTAVLVGHHIGFDLRLLNRALRARALRPLPHPWIDTALLYGAMTGRPVTATLEDVARFCHVPVMGRHTASGDARITAHVFVRLAARLAGRRASVGELLERQLARPGP